MRSPLSRRAFIAGSSISCLGPLVGSKVLFFGSNEAHADLKPGDFRWEPEKSPVGLVAIIVSIPDQQVHVYRNGIRIGLSSCSTGKKGHRTPTGVFTILQKDKDHHSSTYNNAPMPNMNRLTWSGIALHAGNLPGYPASHGCIRLPLKFSALLFGVTHVGTPVILADDHSQPAFVTHPGPVLSALAEDEMDVALAKVAEKKLPPKERIKDTKHITSVLISSADKELTIIKDDSIVSREPVVIENPETPLGSHVFVLVGSHDTENSLHWKSIGFSNRGVKLANSGEDLIARIKAGPELARKVADLMHPGLIFVMTDAPAHPETRSGREFVVMTEEMSWDAEVKREL